MTGGERDPSDVLDRAHRTWSPRAGDAERVRRAIGNVLAGGAGRGAATGTARAPAWTARLLVAGAIAAASGGAGYWAGRRAGLRDAPVAPAGQISLVAEGAPNGPGAARPAPEAQPPLAPSAPVPVRRGGRAGRHESPSEAPAETPSLAVELRALRNTERALRNGNSGLALAFLAELDRQVPHGQLTEERDAAGTLARCASGDRPFGVDLADEFVQRHPASVYRTRVAEACATDRAPTGDSPTRRSQP